MSAAAIWQHDSDWWLWWCRWISSPTLLWLL